MHREAALAAPRKQSSLRTAAIVTICVLGCIAGVSLLALRQTAIQYHHLLEARKDFETTQNALRADLLKQIDETDSLRQQLDAAQRDRKGIRQQLSQLQQEQHSLQKRDGQLTRVNNSDKRQPPLDLESAGTAARSVEAGNQLLPAPSASKKPAADTTAATARTPTLASSNGMTAGAEDAAITSSPQRSAPGSSAASQQEAQAGLTAAQRYPNVANVAYGSARSH
ncbi:hypothetical protein WJX74_005019 [Apatococcus lobatus]|uniref:Uncharacterized protein n=2 Tax=Apatococcus TaxID=904362 RepID=A0AAW1SLP7_9CHLO